MSVSLKKYADNATTAMSLFGVKIQMASGNANLHI